MWIAVLRLLQQLKYKVVSSKDGLNKNEEISEFLNQKIAFSGPKNHKLVLLF